MKLVLADGTTISGRSFGACRETMGEVVFNTGMAGYVETLTDPSYRGQILALTYPLQGNYGVPEGPFESAKIQVQGLVIHRHAEAPSHHASRRTLGDWLKSHDVPAVEGVDTRALTRHLRAHGTIHGRLLLEKTDPGWSERPAEPPPQIDMLGEMAAVAPREVERYEGGDHKILLIDTGAKENIVRCLQGLGASIIRAPWFHPWEGLLSLADGLFLTNGPGDPAQWPRLTERIRHALKMEMPTFGICLGHQLLGLAAGAKTYKLKFGHRSHNQPVMDLLSQRCYLTSQNHGYSVDAATLDGDWAPWFANLNDGSNEGIRHKSKPFASIQFHPEASSGPHDTRFMFRDFMQWVAERRAARGGRRK